jgi:hypothetical protein
VVKKPFSHVLSLVQVQAKCADLEYHSMRDKASPGPMT